MPHPCLPRLAATLLLLFTSGVTSAADPLRFALEAASDTRYARPHDIVLSPDGRALYVADNGNHRIAVLDPVTLEERGSFGDGEVREPHDVAFDRDGHLLVLEVHALGTHDHAGAKLFESVTAAVRDRDSAANAGARETLSFGEDLVHDVRVDLALGPREEGRELE